MKRKKAALYNPYLNTLGGGEKHILSILKVLEEKNYSLDIFWDKNLQHEFRVKFNLSFDYLINFVPNIFKQQFHLLKKFLILRKYDYFFYVTDGSYFFSSAKNNFIFAMVPQGSLYKMTLGNKLKTSGWKFISNSKFTQKYLKSLSINDKAISHANF